MSKSIFHNFKDRPSDLKRILDHKDMDLSFASSMDCDIDVKDGSKWDGLITGIISSNDNITNMFVKSLMINDMLTNKEIRNLLK